jgi:hypothetical protein
MKHVNLMNLERGSKSIIIDLIKKVLENRYDIKPNEDFVHDVVDYTIEKTQVTRLITEHMILNKTVTDLHEDYRLGKIIELLAIVNRAIDVVSLGNDTVQVLPT